jgi:hypothetical protein
LPDGRQTQFVRLCFAKTDAVLDEGAARLNAARLADWAAGES